MQNENIDCQRPLMLKRVMSVAPTLRATRLRPTGTPHACDRVCLLCRVHVRILGLTNAAPGVGLAMVWKSMECPFPLRRRRGLVSIATKHSKLHPRFCLVRMPSKGSAQKKAPAVTKSAKAGLIFPVARLNKAMKQGSGLKRIGGSAPVYATAVTEYIVAEMCAACIRTPHHLPLPLSS